MAVPKSGWSKLIRAAANRIFFSAAQGTLDAVTVTPSTIVGRAATGNVAALTPAQVSALISTGSFVSITADAVADDQNQVLAVDSGTPAAAVNITLPAAVNGRRVVVYDVGGAAATYNITLTPDGAETIGGAAAPYVLDADGGNYELIGEAGVGWHVYARMPQRWVDVAGLITVQAHAETLAVDTTTLPATVTLPAATDGRRVVAFDAKNNAAANPITISPNGSETVNGLASWIVNTKRGRVSLVGEAGVGWHVLADSREGFTDVTGAATVADVDQTVAVNVSGAATLTLPVAVDGRRYTIIDSGGTAANAAITLTPNGAETIAGLASAAIRTNRGWKTLVGEAGVGWHVVAQSGEGWNDITASATLADVDQTVAVNISGAATLTLPVAVDGRRYTIIDTGGTATNAAISLAPNGAETIAGLTAATININRGWLVIVGEAGVGWHIAARSTTAPLRIQNITTTDAIDPGVTCVELAATADATITLPAASAGLVIVLAESLGADGTVYTIAGPGSETIDGQSSITMRRAWEGRMLVCDGTNWHSVADANRGLDARALQSVTTAGITIKSSTDLVTLDGSTPVIVTLPAAGVGRMLCITDFSGARSGATVTIAAAGAATINGAAALAMTTNYQVLDVVSDGTNWAAD